MEEVGLITRNAMDAAYKLRSTELRARALVDSAVTHALRNCPPCDDGDFERFAFDVATTAAALLIQQIYEGDAELKAIRMERDHYKKIAEDAFLVSTPSISSVPSHDC